MDSSFLTGIHVTLGLFALGLFLKMLIQFGLPNHPARFVAYVVGLCASVYFCGLAATDLQFLSPWTWMRWRTLPLIAGSLCLLLQTILLAGSFSQFQQRVISRIPLMGALLCFAFLSQYADTFSFTMLWAGALFLIVSVRKARHQKRLYLKMALMGLFYVGCLAWRYWPVYLAGQIFLFLLIFYLFLFEQSFCVAALIDDFRGSLEGDRQ